jgi:subtilisin family serine protease
MKVLVEIEEQQNQAFTRHAAALDSPMNAVARSESLLQRLTGLGLEVADEMAPVPMFAGDTVAGAGGATGFAAFASRAESPDTASNTVVVSCEVPMAKLDALRQKEGVKVWANSELVLFQPEDTLDTTDHLLDLARSAGGVDCRPFRPAVSIKDIRQLLAVDALWSLGFRGQNIVVGIIDEGINGEIYPVIGGFARLGSQQPGTAAITSHGSMCAADVLVAAPAAKLYDYPFLGIPTSGGALQMFQAVLDQRRRDGTPQLTTNSYGFVGVPPQEQFPEHEIWDLNHPLHRKVREVVASGAPTFFAAGNCGANCPSGACHPSGIGAGSSIHASNSLAEVITVAAVNSRHERIGYSSQGPGMFHPEKPDVAAYSHFYGNFGPGRPAGGDNNVFDNGTSAATPVAAGVAALLMSAFPNLTPDRLRQALVETAIDISKPGRDDDYGYGVINAAAALSFLRSNL